jgi:GTP-binding protein Era
MNKQLKSGFVSIIGRPNVGKSTLLNHLIGEKIAITSSKPQTTRKNLKGIINDPDKGQIVFVDTPGMHKPHHLLGEHLVANALKSLQDVELILFLVDGTSEVGGGDTYIIENVLKNQEKPVYLLINKIDKVPKKDKKKFVEAYSGLYGFKKVFLVSAKHGDNIPELVESIYEILPEGQPFYEDDSLTDISTREIAGELIREQIFRLLGEEVPHSSAVLIDTYSDNPAKNLTSIRAVIFVERDSQKGIVIGKGGSKLREIGEAARKEIEQLIGNKVFLELNVKLMEKWRRNKNNLKKLGYIVD